MVTLYQKNNSDSVGDNSALLIETNTVRLRRLFTNPVTIVIATIVYSLVRLVSTTVRYGINTSYNSDFFASFPAPAVARAFGKADTFLVGGDIERYLQDGQWLYGPVYHLITVPLFLFSDKYVAFDALLYGTLLFFISSCLILIYFSFQSPFWSYRTAGVIFIVGNMSPAFEALGQRNIEIFELLILSVAVVLYDRKFSRLAALLIGVGAGIKFVLGAIVPYLIINRKTDRTWPTVLTTGLVIAVLTQLLLGWQDFYILKMLLGTDHGAYKSWGGVMYHPLNQAVSGALYRLLGSDNIHVPLISTLVALVSVCLGLVWMYRSRGKSNWLVQWSVCLTAVLLMLPHNEYYYFCLLTVPLLIQYLILSGHGSIRQWILFWIAYVLIAWPIPLSLLNSIVDKVIGRHVWLMHLLLDWSLPFIGALLLLLLLLKSQDDEINLADRSLVHTDSVASKEEEGPH